MRTIALFNQKGGVAKTTSCLNLGAALTILGKKVLLIDADPQGSLTKCFIDVDPSEHPTTYEVLTGAAPIREAVIPGKYDLIPLDLRIAGAEDEMTGKEDALRKALRKVAKDYDFCLIDCGPSLSVFSAIALTAADEAIVPVAAEYMALDGLALVTETVDLIQKTRNPGLKISGVIVTLYDVRRRQDRDCEAAIREYFPQTFEDVVRRSSKVAEAPGYGMDIFEYDPKNIAAAAYMNIAKKIINQ